MYRHEPLLSRYSVPSTVTVPVPPTLTIPPSRRSKKKSLRISGKVGRTRVLVTGLTPTSTMRSWWV